MTVQNFADEGCGGAPMPDKAVVAAYQTFVRTDPHTRAAKLEVGADPPPPPLAKQSTSQHSAAQMLRARRVVSCRVVS